MQSESEWIAYLKKNFRSSACLGIGDDAAILKKQAITKDLFVEGIHFRREWVSTKDLVWKVITPNVLDILSMGAKPQWYFLGIAAPPYFLKKLKHFMQELKSLQKFYGISLLGGDLVKSSVLLFSITMIGNLSRKPLLRGRGRDGDQIVLSGKVGGAALGLRQLKSKQKDIQETETFLSPKINIKETLSLINDLAPKGAIDISDGLCLDLPRLLGKGYGVELDPSTKWIAPAVKKAIKEKDRQIQFALESGEEPVLALLVPKEKKITRGFFLGKVSKKEGVYWAGEKLERLRGFDHFL